MSATTQQPSSKTVAGGATPPSDQIIAATNVVKTYNTGKITVNALRGVNFSVERG